MNEKTEVKYIMWQIAITGSLQTSTPRMRSTFRVVADGFLVDPDDDATAVSALLLLLIFVFCWYSSSGSELSGNSGTVRPLRVKNAIFSLQIVSERRKYCVKLQHNGFK